jgi:hypothetical protein
MSLATVNRDAVEFKLDPSLQDVLKGVDLLVGALTAPAVLQETPPYGYVKQFAEPPKLTAVDYRHIVTGYLITWHNQLVQLRQQLDTRTSELRSEKLRLEQAQTLAEKIANERNLLLAKLEEKTEELSTALHTIEQIGRPTVPVVSPAVAS